MAGDMWDAYFKVYVFLRRSEDCPLVFRKLGARFRLTSKVLGIPDSEILWCGIALGYEDKSAPVNTLRSKRDDVDSFTKFMGLMVLILSFN